jgi:hypothetical protein
MEVPDLKRTIATPALYDFERNGMADIVVGTEDGSLMVVKNSPKRKGMEIISALKISNGPITSPVVIGDVNGDGLVEIVAVNTINAVQVITTNVKTIKNCLLWPVYLGNNLHSGTQTTIEDTRPYYLMALAGLLVMFIVIIFHLTWAAKKAARRPRTIYI